MHIYNIEVLTLVEKTDFLNGTCLSDAHLHSTREASVQSDMANP